LKTALDISGQKMKTIATNAKRRPVSAFGTNRERIVRNPGEVPALRRDRRETEGVIY
jgi:hypothetical protein